MRTEKEFLTTLETYLGILVRQNEVGRELDIADELRFLLSMTRHRVQELEKYTRKGEERD